MEIKLLPAYDHPREIRALFSEYTTLLIAGDSAFQEYLALQHYDRELEHLEEKYGMPDGRLYLAYCGEEAAGCVGLRRLDAHRCEMKRLYVRPRFQGKHIGGLLARTVIADAKKIGYSHMLLDTFPFLTAALQMYKTYGFYEVPCYNDNPMEHTIYMELDLKEASQ